MPKVSKKTELFPSDEAFQATQEQNSQDLLDDGEGEDGDKTLEAEMSKFDAAADKMEKSLRKKRKSEMASTPSTSHALQKFAKKRPVPADDNAGDDDDDDDDDDDEDEGDVRTPRKKPRVITFHLPEFAVKKAYTTENDKVMSIMNVGNNFEVCHVLWKGTVPVVRIIRSFFNYTNKKEKKFSMDIPIIEFETMQKAFEAMREDREYRISYGAAIAALKTSEKY